jgi:hypothetical protein
MAGQPACKPLDCSEDMWSVIETNFLTCIEILVKIAVITRLSRKARHCVARMRSSTNRVACPAMGTRLFAHFCFARIGRGC